MGGTGKECHAVVKKGVAKGTYETRNDKRKNPFVTKLQTIQHAESNRFRLRSGLLNREWHFDTVPEEKR